MVPDLFRGRLRVDGQETVDILVAKGTVETHVLLLHGGITGDVDGMEARVEDGISLNLLAVQDLGHSLSTHHISQENHLFVLLGGLVTEQTLLKLLLLLDLLGLFGGEFLKSCGSLLRELLRKFVLLLLGLLLKLVLLSLFTLLLALVHVILFVKDQIIDTKDLVDSFPVSEELEFEALLWVVDDLFKLYLDKL